MIIIELSQLHHHCQRARCNRARTEILSCLTAIIENHGRAKINDHYRDLYHFESVTRSNQNTELKQQARLFVHMGISFA